MFVTYGQSGNGLLHGQSLGSDSPLISADVSGSTSGGSSQYSTLPLAVPFASTPVDSSTATSNTATSGVNSGTSGAAAGTPFSWSTYLLDVISHPGQHIIAVIVLALVAWWAYKHIIKKL